MLTFTLPLTINVVSLYTCTEFLDSGRKPENLKENPKPEAQRRDPGAIFYYYNKYIHMHNQKKKSTQQHANFQSVMVKFKNFPSPLADYD